jgi:hypothetical protein
MIASSTRYLAYAMETQAQSAEPRIVAPKKKKKAPQP